MAVDGVEAGASGGAGVLGVLGEGHCLGHTITTEEGQANETGSLLQTQSFHRKWS